MRGGCLGHRVGSDVAATEEGQKDKHDGSVGQQEHVDTSGCEPPAHTGADGPRHILTMPYPSTPRTNVQPVRNFTR